MICRTCSHDKPEQEFHKSRHGTPETQCKKCKHQVQWERRQDPEVKKRVNIWQRTNYSQAQRRKWSLHTNYRLSMDDFTAMVIAQDGKCGSCRDELAFDTRMGCHVDHCHKTGRIRGLLCGKCNSALGMLNDDPDRILNLARYLERGP